MSRPSRHCRSWPHSLLVSPFARAHTRTHTHTHARAHTHVHTHAHTRHRRSFPHSLLKNTPTSSLRDQGIEERIASREGMRAAERMTRQQRVCVDKWMRRQLCVCVCVCLCRRENGEGKRMSTEGREWVEHRGQAEGREGRYSCVTEGRLRVGRGA